MIAVLGRGAQTASQDQRYSFSVMPLIERGDLVPHRKTTNHWIGIRLIGRKSNRDGIGARVEIEAGGMRQRDEIRSGGSYLSQNDMRLHFGLGSAARVERVTVHWPSGSIDRVSAIPADRHISIQEGTESWRSVK